MTREQAYERLELPVGTDLQQVRRKFQQMHNDFQMRIDNAPTPKLRQAFERGMEEIKQAYALLNESACADDSASLPRMERTFVPSEEPRTASVPPPSREEQSLRPEPPTMDEALAIFGISPADSAQNATEKVERHIAELRRMHDAAVIPGIRDAYRAELEKTKQAHPIAERWITDRRGQEQRAQPEAASQVSAAPAWPRASSASGGKPKNRTALYAGIGAAAALLLAGIYFAVLRNGNNGQDIIPPKTDTIAPQETADSAPETKTDRANPEPKTAQKNEVKTESKPEPKPEKKTAGATAATKALIAEGRKLLDGASNKQAEAKLREALNAGDEDAVPYLAHALHGLKRHDEILTLANKHPKTKEHPLMQYRMGSLYHFGNGGLAKNYAEAIRWYKRSADQGNAWAQYNLGVMYANGQGVAKDEAEAAKWYRKAAEQGDDYAQNDLGLMYENGRGVKQDDAQAARWYRKAADQGLAVAQANLAKMHYFGRGVSGGYKEAAKWYGRAAEQGDIRAQNNMAFMHQNGFGMERNYAEALKWYRKTADKGDAWGQEKLGGMYANGQGVAQDYAEAVKWFRRAADQGNADAQNSLGVRYANGQGVAKDDAEAVKWYRKAANQGNAWGQNNLGVMYRDGRGGLPQDDAEAVKWFRKAVAQGNENAKKSLQELGY